jgi:outer membrane protein assembly factor BamB
VLSCGSDKDGEPLWNKRLKGGFWATPVVAGGHIFCPNQEGQCFVISVENEGEVVATNEIGESVLGSPAVANDALYIRGEKHLIKVANQ